MDEFVPLLEALSDNRHDDVSKWIQSYSSQDPESPPISDNWTFLAYCAIITYSFPGLTLASTVANWAARLPSIQSFRYPGVWHDSLAKELAASCYSQYNFTGGSLASFVKAKLIHDGHYSSNIDQMIPLIELATDDNEFDRFNRGLLQPYQFYRQQILSPITLDKYLAISDDYSQVFDVFSRPLDGTEPIALDAWLLQVILPVIHYYNCDVTPLLKWLFGDQTLYLSGQDLVDYFTMLNKVMVVIVGAEKTAQQMFRPLVLGYLATVYYFAVCQIEGEKLLSMKLNTIYDTVALTLTKIMFLVEPEGNPVQPPSVDLSEVTYGTLMNFIADGSNPLRPLYDPSVEAVEYLLLVVKMCQQMSTTSLLTVRKCLEYQTTEVPGQYDRDIARLLLTLTEGTWKGWWTAIEQFMTAFVHNIDEQHRLYAIVLERFLFANLYLGVVELWEHHRNMVDDGTWFRLIMEKFWILFNLATSLNEKQGELYYATQCIGLLDLLTGLGLEVAAQDHQQVVAVKHLLKLLLSMRNFKLNNTTPKLLVTVYVDNPVGVTNIILERNPKLYLAFDKLFKILNDFALFAEYENGQHRHQRTLSSGSQLSHQTDHGFFPKLKAACIELALVDQNFTWAHAQLELLFDYYLPAEINQNWLTFYQVGRWINTKWYDDNLSPEDHRQRRQILQKQQQVLGRLLTNMEALNDSQRVVLHQWRQVTQNLGQCYSPQVLEAISDTSFANHKLELLDKITGEVNQMALSLLNDATNTSSQAGEKLLKMFVSGLGWAIGASRQGN